MSRNLSSDIAQLQVVFKYLKHGGKPYWNGPVDGRYTDALGNKINEFESNEGVPVTGEITPLSADLTLQGIRRKCKGTPYATMHGLPDSSIVFSIITEPMPPQKHAQATVMELWHAAMDDAYAHLANVTKKLLLPMMIKDKDWGTYLKKDKTHLGFKVSMPSVYWYSKTADAFIETMPNEAKLYLIKHLSNGNYTQLNSDMTFITTESYANPNKIEELLKEYEAVLAKQEKLQKKIRLLVPEVRRIVNVFQKEHKNIQAELDERQEELVSGLIVNEIEKRAVQKAATQLGSMGKKDWDIVVRGLGKKVFRILDGWTLVKAVWDIGEMLIFLPKQFFIAEIELKPLAKEIEKYEILINKLQDSEIEPLLAKLKKNGMSITKLKTIIKKEGLNNNE